MKKSGTSLPYRLILRQFTIQTALFGILFVAILTFQNCGGPLPEDQADQSSTGTTDFPFAFDTQMDTVAYMSCVSAPDTSMYFSFKAAALYPGSGVRFRSDVSGTLNSLSNADALKKLQGSSLNNGVTQQIAIRQIGNYGTMINNTLSTYRSALAVDPIVSTIKQNGVNNFSQYFAGQPAGSRFITVGTGYAANEATLSQYRQYVQTNSPYGYTVGLTFGKPGGAAMGPTDGLVSVYGKGLTFSYTNPTPSVVNQLSKVISSVSELNLETGAGTGSSWSCPSANIFKIVRNQDRGVATVCFSGQSSDAASLTDVARTANPADDADYVRARTMLSASWAIDMTKGCIVSRLTAANSCYGALPANTTVNYGTTGSCQPGSNTCAHYVSICQKN